MGRKIKIRLYGVHLGYVEEDILKAFECYCGVINLNPWIKEQAYNDFEVYLNNEYDLELFKDKLSEFYYENIADWLKEKLRAAILSNKKKEEEIMNIQEMRDINNEIIQSQEGTLHKSIKKDFEDLNEKKKVKLKQYKLGTFNYEGMYGYVTNETDHIIAIYLPFEADGGQVLGVTRDLYTELNT